MDPLQRKPTGPWPDVEAMSTVGWATESPATGPTAAAPPDGPPPAWPAPATLQMAGSLRDLASKAAGRKDDGMFPPMRPGAIKYNPFKGR